MVAQYRSAGTAILAFPVAEEYAKTGNRNIRSRVTSDPNTFHSTIWLFEATYRNF